MDPGAATGHTRGMLRSCLAALLLLATLAGCASNSGHPLVDRSNGQPGWLPCMAGDRLCGPQ